ncbi:MAG: efflux RND transporter periplasmic adaptor subunit [Caldiserica bacterium]|nr:efflux RND transporter periplasmic adaptor subunit [Caldisericota bacterium]
MKKIIIWIVALVLVGGGAYRVYRIIEAGRKGEKRVVKAKEIPVRVEKVIPGIIVGSLSFSGNIIPNTEVTVYSKVGGEVKELAVDVGDKVRKGALIARIEKDKLILQEKRLKASLDSAEANFSNIEKEYARVKNLFQKKAVSQQKMDNVSTAYKSARARVEELKSALSLARIQLADSTITAPIGGIIARKFVEEGDMVTATTQLRGTPIVAIVDMDTVKITVSVDEKDIAKLKIGERAEIKVDAYPGKIFPGRVARISPTFDPLSRTALVEIDVPNPGHYLKPGMFARIKVIIQEHNNALKVRKEAIINGINVFVVKEGKASLRNIVPGIQEGDWVEVLSGVAEGEDVVIRGQKFLKDGMKVKVIEE